MDISNRPGTPPPDGYESNFDNPSTGNYFAVPIITFCVVLSAVAIGVRFYAKFVERKLLVADYFTFVAFPVFWVYAYYSYKLSWTGGYLVHQWDIRLEDVPAYNYVCVHSTLLPSCCTRLTIAQIIWLITLLYLWAIALTKCAILLEWVAIFVPKGERNCLTLASWATCLALLILAAILFILDLLNCTPFEANWNPSIPGSTCRFEISQFGIASSTTNFVFDLVPLFIAQKVIWGLRLPTHKKWGVSFIFLIGLAGCAASIRKDLPGRLESLSTQITDLIVVLEEVNALLEPPHADGEQATLVLNTGNDNPDSTNGDDGNTKHHHDGRTEANIRSVLVPCSHHLESLRAIVEHIKLHCEKGGPSMTVENRLLLEETSARVERYSPTSELGQGESHPDPRQRKLHRAAIPPPLYGPPPPSNAPRASSLQQIQSVAVQVTTGTSHCGGGHCRCVCHSVWGVNTPGGFFNRVVGQLFLGYSGLSGLSPSCNMSSCEAARKPEVTAVYWFHMGLFWSIIGQFNLSCQANVGPQFELKTLRRVPDSAAYVNYAVLHIFSHFHRPLNRSALLAYLVQALTDLGLNQPLTTDLSPRTKANDLLLQGATKTTEDALMPLSGGSDWADEQEFTTPHIESSLGYQIGTPLNCAARNASDPVVIGLLLQYGVNPDATGVDRHTPLIHAARKNMPEFAHLLLQYGANINAVASDGQTPLTTAIVNNNYDVLPLLLERWADYIQRVPTSQWTESFACRCSICRHPND
ncbi:hypothetical protein F5Y14DRAFT_452634 [Nemania sp. NC0429]|nr:hypothetical protein F5Y14DRAFT_452634 [Nemania sp. NC0429]